MEGVRFGSRHSYDDFGLILNSISISSPEPKTYYVEVPGADGKIDITESMGELKYKNRTISIQFTYKGNHNEQLHKYSELNNEIHGHKMDISIDADGNYHYEGRVKVEKCEHQPYICTFTVSCDVEPYKYYVADDWLWNPFDFENGFINKLSNLTIDGSSEVMVIGCKKNSVPWITCSTDMDLKYDGVVYNLKSGKNRFTDIKIYSGENFFTFIGNGTVTIDFKGGDL